MELKVIKMIGEFINKANELFTAFEFIDKIPDYLYHYSSQNSVFNIINNGELWLSNIKDMNDPTEVSFGVKVIKNILINEKNKYCDEIIKVLELHEEAPLFQEYFFYDKPTFIFSLSQKEDSLSQWINYGDNGGGLSFKMITKKLIENIKTRSNSTYFCYLFPINYFNGEYVESSIQIKNFKSLVSNFLEEAYHKFIETTNDYDEVFFKNYFISMIYIFASMIKADFHQEEAEWRILIIAEGPGNKNIHPVMKGNIIKTVYKIIFETDSPYNLPKQRELSDIFESIMIGPRNHGNYSLKQSINFLMYKCLTSFGVVNFSKGKLV